MVDVNVLFFVLGLVLFVVNLVLGRMATSLLSGICSIIGMLAAAWLIISSLSKIAGYN